MSDASVFAAPQRHERMQPRVTSLSGVVHTREDIEVKRQLLLRHIPMRTQPTGSGIQRGLSSHGSPCGQDCPLAYALPRLTRHHGAAL
jgi:hypothetical protein